MNQPREVQGNREYVHYPPDPRLAETKHVILPFLDVMKKLTQKYDDGSMSSQELEEFDRLQMIQEMQRQDAMD